MKILLAPAETKNEGGEEKSICKESFFLEELFSKRKEVLDIYENHLEKSSIEELSIWFGLKKLEDVKKYKNLSAVDLEYRSKLVELMYLDDFLYDRIEEFIVFASSRNRNFSHPYANYSIIKNLSKIFFNSGFESDISKWKEISVEKINATSKKLLEENNAILAKNPEIDKIIN